MCFQIIWVAGVRVWPAKVAINVKEEKAQFSLLHKNIMHEATGTKLKISMYPLHEARTYQLLSSKAYCVEQQVPFNLKRIYKSKKTEAKQYEKQALGSLEDTNR